MHRMWLMRALWAFIIALALGTMACTQISEPDLKREVELLKRNQEVLRQEVEALKAQVGNTRPSGPSVRDTEFELGDNPVLGNDAASLTLVEFTDYQ